MNVFTRRITFLIAHITIAGSLWAASTAWEKGLSQKIYDPEISPDGCYRVETLKPFWILPDILHPNPHPGEEEKPDWFYPWTQPGFFRLYDQRSNILISETSVYDLSIAGGKTYWSSGSGIISSGLIIIGPRILNCVNDVAHMNQD